MEKTLAELICEIQNGNNDSLEKVIEKFKPSIKKFTRRLNYEESETDLIIVFIRLVRFLDLDNFQNFTEGALVMYLYNSLKNKSVDLFRKYVLKKPDEVAIDMDFPTHEENFENKLLVDNLLNLDILSERQKSILKQSYLYDFSDAKIASSLNISRQAVHKQKKRSLAILKDYLGNSINI